MLIYHGSQDIIQQPVFGKGKTNNDYGMGFYCTENIELAKEWGTNKASNGYANVYQIETEDLNILNLNDKKYNILHWLTILLQNRTFKLTNQIEEDGKNYLIKNFSIDTSPFDVIKGYRADDSYFSFAQDFLSNGISLKKLSMAMKLGRLGEQFVLVSEKAFSKLKFIKAEIAEKEKYYVLKTERNNKAREDYKREKTNISNYKDELFLMDILRQEIKSNDSRLQ